MGNRPEGEEMADRELLEGLQGVDTMNESIRIIYRRFYPGLSWYVINNSGTGEDAKDIFQEVVVSFIHLVQAGKFRGESSVRTFLFSMNRHAWLNELKKRSRALAREERFEREQDRQVRDVSFFIADKEARQLLDQLIAKLGENCRKILTLCYFENRAMREMVEILEYENEQVVRNKKYKCLKQLREIIVSDPAALQVLKNMMHG